MSGPRHATITAIAVVLTASLLFPNCSDDTECPTCPDGTGDAQLQLTVLHPQPDPIRYNSIWAASSDDVFVAADAGAVLHLDDGEWKRYDTGVEANLMAVWGTSPSDVHAVGHRGVIVHFDGASWRSMDSGVLAGLYGVWGGSSDTVYAVGDYNTCVRYAGGIWTPLTLPIPAGTRSFRDIWGTDPAHFYIVGSEYDPFYGGTLVSFEGGRWSADNNGGYLTAVWAASPDTIYAGDNSGSMWRRTGGVWGQQPHSGDRVNSIRGTAWNDIWAAGSRWDDVDFKNYATLRHYDGTGWSDVAGSAYPHGFNSVSCVSASEAYIAGEGSQLLRWSGASWNQINDTWATGDNLEAIWGFDSGEMWAFGQYGTILHYDGVAWSAEPPVTGDAIYDVWAYSPDSIYAVGSNSIVLQNQGSGWSEFTHPFQIGTLQSIWGTSPRDVRAGGNSGEMIVADGTTLTVEQIGDDATGSIIDLWASAPDDWYAVTHAGVYHYDGDSWAPLSLDGRIITAVTGVSATEVYFAGGSGRGADKAGTRDGGASRAGPPVDSGFLLRYDGSGYTEVASGFDLAPEDIRAVGHNSVYMAGSSGGQFGMAHYNGSRVAVGWTGVTSSARGVWAAGNTAYAVGWNGVIARTRAD